VGYVTTQDGTEIYFKDWGDGQPVVLCHGWPLSADSWDPQILFLAWQGLRCVAHDRRGHGRSAQSWQGNDMDTYADDLAAVFDALDLREVTLVGFSTGGGEVARYIGRHGTDRVAKAVLISAVPPFMLRTDDNPGGVPVESFDALRDGSEHDRAQLYRDLADGPFYGRNRGLDVSQGIRDAWWADGMRAGHHNTFECIEAFSATDFRADLAAFDVPTLVIHGEDDQVVPVDVGGRASAARIDGAVLKVYPGAPHGLTHTHTERLNQDLLEFIKA
jgi:non-heme chloroperoxidase